jgi:uncharacterized membrane protein YoaK (UPF0700 family)
MPAFLASLSFEEHQEHVDAGLLSFLAGFVDTAVFVGLFGLFTAHVTGNLALIGTELVNREGEVFSKLLSLPVFVVTVIVTVHLAWMLRSRGRHPVSWLLCIEAVLLSLAVAASLRMRPSDRPDDLFPMLAGMLAAAAMAVQNAMLRVELTALPSTTVMTNNVTQALIDATSLAGRHIEDPVVRERTRRRMGTLWASVLAFTAGAAAGAAGYAWVQFWSLGLPAAMCIAMSWRFRRR